jgi:hypothetical protein
MDDTSLPFHEEDHNNDEFPGKEEKEKGEG